MLYQPIVHNPVSLSSAILSTNACLCLSAPIFTFNVARLQRNSPGTLAVSIIQCPSLLQDCLETSTVLRVSAMLYANKLELAINLLFGTVYRVHVLIKSSKPSTFV